MNEHFRRGFLKRAFVAPLVRGTLAAFGRGAGKAGQLIFGKGPMGVVNAGFNTMAVAEGAAEGSKAVRAGRDALTSLRIGEMNR